jgi:hypothetical protein
MKLRISFFAEPSGPDVLPLPLNYPLGDYDSVEQARKIAFTDGDRPGSRVHSIIIESVDGGAINERWIRWADGWRPADTGAKRPRDPAQLAKLIVDIATGEVEDREPTPEEQGKSAKAVKRGRAGGLKGGATRAARMTPEQRAEVARVAAQARWKKST